MDEAAPKLLNRVIEDCEHLKTQSESNDVEMKDVDTADGVQGWAAHHTISKGALVLLRKRLFWMRTFAGMALDGYEDLMR